MAFLPTNASQVQQFAVALYGIKVGSTTMSAVQADITSKGGLTNALNGYYAASFGNLPTATVATSFAKNLGLTGDALTAGAAYVEGQLNGAAAGARGAVISNILNLFSTLSTDATYGAAAQAWNAKVESAIGYTGSADAAVAAGSVAEGQPFALSTGTDVINGTSGNDTINAVLQANGATGTTVQPGDVVNGGAGTDTLSISVAGALATAGYTISALQTSGVEKVLLNNFNTNDALDNTVDTALMTGLTTVGVSASDAAGDSIFSNMTAIVAAEMTNGAGDLTLTYGTAAVAGTADSQALSVSNLSAGTFTSNGIETLNINSGLVKSTLAAVVSDKLKAVKVTGATDLTITAAIDFVAGTNDDTTIDATIDATAFTGKLSVDASDTNDIEVKGGSGNDTIAMAGALTSKDKIDGGSGTDTLTMTAAALSTQFAGVSNIETVAFTASTGTVAMDVSKLSAGVTTVEVDHSDSDDTNTAAEVLTISNLDGQAVSIKHSTANAGAGASGADADGASITITGKTDTAADTVNVKLAAIDTEANDKGLETLNVANFETVNIESALPTTGTVTNQVTALTATSAKAVNVSGAADLTLTAVSGGAMTSLNASSLAGKLVATLAGDKVAVTLGQKDSTINFGSTLNNDDAVTGGAGKDTVTATVTGLIASTGALKIADVETINLTTSGANALNLAGVTGTGVTIAVTDNVQTITGFNLAHTIQLGLAADESATASEIDVTAANATGTDDTLKVTVENTNGTTTSIIDASDIENLALTVVAAGSATLDLTTFEGKAVTVASKAGVTGAGTVALGTMHKNISSVTSTYAGAVTANFSNNTAGATFVGAGTAIQNVTGTAKADTVTIGSTGAIAHVVSGGSGTDTVNLTAKNGLVDVGSLDAEKINIAVVAGDDITLTTSFHVGVDDIVLTGGNSLSTFTTGTLVDEIQTLNASAFGGNIVATVANDKLDSTVTFTGGASTKDEVNVTIATAATTYALKSTGVDILRVVSGAAATTTVSVAAATGISEIEVDQGANVATQTFSITGLTGSETVTLKASDDATAGANEHILKAVLADATGSANTIKFKIGGGTIAADARLATDDIETVTIDSDNASTLDLSLLAMTETADRMKLVVIGDSALTATLTGADITTIDASGMSVGGSFVQNGRSATSEAVTYTGSAGADSFIMTNTKDVISGGAGTDTLVISTAAILGGLNVDLSATDDQIVSFNGSATGGTVTLFENVDASGYTGNFGAQITAIKTGSTITGTANADQITGGAGADTFNVTSTAASANDVMDGGSGTADTINIVATTDFADTDSNIVNIENVTIGTGSVNVDLTAQSEGFTITGGTGDNVIVGGSGADKITAGLGADTITIVSTSGMDVIDLTEASGTSVDTIVFDVALQSAAAVVVNGWGSKGTDLVKIDGDDAGIALTNGTSAPLYLEIGAAAADAAAANGANDTVVELTQNLSAAAATAITNYQATQNSTTYAALVTAIAGSTGAGEAFDGGLNAVFDDAGDKVIFIVDDGDESVVFLYTAGATGATADVTLEAAEISIIGVFDGLVTLATIATL